MSHRALRGVQSAGQLLRSGKPAADANENPRTIDTVDKKIIACRNDIQHQASCLFGKRTCGENAKEAQHNITGRHLVCEMHVAPSVGCEANKGDMLVEIILHHSVSCYMTFAHLSSLKPLHSGIFMGHVTFLKNSGIMGRRKTKNEHTLTHGNLPSSRSSLGL